MIAPNYNIKYQVFINLLVCCKSVTITILFLFSLFFPPFGSGSSGTRGTKHLWPQHILWLMPPLPKPHLPMKPSPLPMTLLFVANSSMIEKKTKHLLRLLYLQQKFPSSVAKASLAKASSLSGASSFSMAKASILHGWYLHGQRKNLSKPTSCLMHLSQMPPWPTQSKPPQWP